MPSKAGSWRDAAQRRSARSKSPGQRHHPPNPRQLARQGDGQHRRQLVEHPARLAKLGHLPQGLAQAAKPVRLRRLRLPAAPALRLVQPAQRLRRAGAQRARQNLLRTAMLPLAATAPPGRAMLCGRSPGRAVQPQPNKPVPARSGPCPTGTGHPQLLPNRQKVGDPIQFLLSCMLV